MVIADTVMPEMDGPELVQRIRCSADFSDMPVVLRPSSADEENVRRAEQLGCRHYLLKPARPALLIEKVSEVLKVIKPAIKSSTEIRERSGLGKAPYDEIGEKFRMLPEHTSDTLGQTTDPADPALTLSLSRLAEAAVLFGAHRMGEAVESFQKQGLGEGSPCGDAPLERLLAEVRRARRSLPAKTSSPEPQPAS